MRSNFYDIFPKKKILIGMLHLAGENYLEKLDRIGEEVRIYKEEGLDGAIVEDYHGSIKDIVTVLDYLKRVNHGLIIGVNALANPYLSFALADKYNGKFVQFDSVQIQHIDVKRYDELRKRYPNICVLGGVRFKYIPETGRSLEEDIIDGMSRCDAIVTTGEGTGVETPTQKLRDFRTIIGTFPLIDGAGVNDKNIREQMEICEGAIIGSYFKGGDTKAKVQRNLVRTLINQLK